MRSFATLFEHHHPRHAHFVRPTDGRQCQLGIDTNMLVRDHATHFDRARRLIPREITAAEDVL